MTREVIPQLVRDVSRLKGGGFPSGSPAWASTAETIAGTSTTKAVTPAGLKAALPFVIVTPTGGDDTTMLNAAAASVAPGGTVWFKPGIYQTTGLVTFNQVNVQMPFDLNVTMIRYTGSGNAVLIDGADDCDIDIYVQKSTMTWDDGVDTTSEGIVVRNTANARFRFKCLHFWHGITLRGDDAGVVHNQIHFVGVSDNKTQVHFDIIGSGWVNQNTFSGQLALSSGATSYAGTIAVDMSEGGNGNTFLQNSWEGSYFEKTVIVASSYNLFLGCRFEANVADSFEFTSTSQSNMVIGGYSNLNPDQDIFLDAGLSNMILSAGGMSIYHSAGTQTGIIIEDQNSTRDAITLRSVGRTEGEITSLGKIVLYDTVGKEVDSTPIVTIDPISTTRGLRFGFPGTADVGRIYTFNASYMGVIGHLCWGTDNTYDIGISGSNRPRHFYLAGNARIGGALDHDGTTVGFYGVTPTTRPTAYTQTYSTANKTLAAYTADVESGAYTGAADSEAKLADLNALRVAYENLRAFTEDAVQMLNSVVDDLQALGLLQ